MHQASRTGRTRASLSKVRWKGAHQRWRLCTRKTRRRQRSPNWTRDRSTDKGRHEARSPFTFWTTLDNFVPKTSKDLIPDPVWGDLIIVQCGPVRYSKSICTLSIRIASIESFRPISGVSLRGTVTATRIYTHKHLRTLALDFMISVLRVIVESSNQLIISL